MPKAPRLPWRVLFASTLLAVIAATATYVLLDDGGDEQSADDGTSQVTLVPEGDRVDPDAATFTEFDGTEVPLASLQGKPVVVNFFSSTCVPCITEMPAFEQVHQQLGDQVTFLGLAVADRQDEAEELVQRTGVTYHTAQDRDASVISALDGTLLPTTVVLGADGAVLEKHDGALDADELRSLLADELGIHPGP